MRERGQSEIVSFATVFGIILLAVALVSTSGYTGLQNAQEHRQLTNGEQSFAVLADNVEDVTEGGVPSRATQLRLGEGSLSMTDSVEITVTGQAVADPSRNFSYDYTLSPVEYEAGDSRIVYSAGALLRVDRGSAVMFRDPGFVLTNETVVLPLVRTYAAGTVNVGSGTVLVRAERTDSRVLRTNATAYDLTITVTTPRADAWRRSLGASPATACSQSGETVTCTMTTSRLAVTVDHVRVSIP